MLKKRIIPILLFKDGYFVRSEGFNTHQIIGNPIHQLQRLNQWDIDELVILDISSEKHDHFYYGPNINFSPLQGEVEREQVFKAMVSHCFFPLTLGGNIKCIEDMKLLLNAGADKVAINSVALESPDIINQSTIEFGSQAITVSIDLYQETNGEYLIFSHKIKKCSTRNPFHWIAEIEERGAGEILLNFVDRDGMKCGYDYDFIEKISNQTNLPIISCGGAKNAEDMLKILMLSGVAAAASNLFLFEELSYPHAKMKLKAMFSDVR